MPLTVEIAHAAQTLGALLGEAPSTQEYLRLLEQADQDPAASTLEKRYTHLFQELVAQEQNGIQLDQAQLDEYYDLQHQVQENPSLHARNAQFEAVKALFAETALRMNAILGFDYTILAR